MTTRIYERDRILRSGLTGRWFYCPKVEVTGPNLYRVVGKKVDVTHAVEEVLAFDRAQRAAEVPAVTKKRAGKKAGR